MSFQNLATRNGSHGSSADCSSDGEEQDEPSSSLHQDTTVEDVLSSFREKWQKELKISPKGDKMKSLETEPDDYDNETKAKIYFLNGVEMEKNGKLYEAIQFYRRAVQLVPDIESRIDIPKNKPIRDQTLDPTPLEKEDDNESDDGDEEEIKEGELLPRIQKKFSKMSAICVPKNEQKTSHISVLPTEMLLYILRWVVSSELDLRSLEMFSMVCRGFYLCARDPEVWRLACLRVWGLNCGSSPYNYLSWRHMFIDRTRLHFNGCYIGKTTYIRHGENSFQDQFYRPWHLVSYYRYLRFFPEGVVLVLTSSDEPAQCVGQMKHRNPRSPILQGYYRLKDDKVTVVVQRQEKNKHLQGYKKSKRRGGDLEVAEQTFHIELQIKSINKRRHVQLVWTHYSVFTKSLKGDESTCNFDLVGNRFPPFWFSRVKSYTAESDGPLM